MSANNENICKTKVCKVCLERVKESNILEKRLYKQITNIWEISGNQPKDVCRECLLRVVTGATFRDKALKSEELLYEMLQRNS